MSFTSFKEIIEEGDTVILYISVSQIYALKVQPTVCNKHGVPVDYTFQTKYGALRVMDLVGKNYGSKVNLTKGYAHILYPSAELWTLTLPHRTQILYTPDISLVITELNIHCGSIVCEAGTGSGSLSHAILRAIGPTGHLYTSDFHQERVEAVKKEFKDHGYDSRVTVKRQDVSSSGWEVSEIADAVFLDLPKPWDALYQAIKAIKKEGGRICSFSPCIEQVSKTCEAMRAIGLSEINTVENLQREFQLRTLSLPPVTVKKLPVTDVLQQCSKNKINDVSVKKQKLEDNNELESEDITAESEDITAKSEDITAVCKVEVSTSRENYTDSKLIELGSGNDTEISDVDTVNNCSESKIPQQEFNMNSNKPKNCFMLPDVKFKTGIPFLKMPGHTGYLTFATVPPHLDRQLALYYNK